MTNKTKNVPQDTSITRRLHNNATNLLSYLFDGVSITTLINLILSRIMTIISVRSWVGNLFRWCPTSPDHLEETERKLLTYIKTPYRGYFVNIGSGYGLETNKIWTIEMESDPDKMKNKLPILVIHGFGAGNGIWAHNIDSFAAERKVYAIDMLGFGRSSRPYFSDRECAENQLVESIERWRKAQRINDKLIILGHSFGAYISLCYSLQFPQNVSRVILDDPWGIPSQEQAQQTRNTYHLPWAVRMVSSIVFNSFLPLTGLRAAGPWGPKLVRKMRPDLRRKYEPVFGENDGELILHYLYHCNAQNPPSGEIAFKSLALPLGWAKYPLIERIEELDKSVNLTFIYGSRSWIDRQPGFQIKYILGNERVDVHVVQGAGHHIHADKYSEFNSLVTIACAKADKTSQNEQLMTRDHAPEKDKLNGVSKKKSDLDSYPEEKVPLEEEVVTIIS